MKVEKYLITRDAIVVYLRNKQRFCFRKNIIKDLVSIGFKKTNVILTLRQMRKEKLIRKGFRRWGL